MTTVRQLPATIVVFAVLTLLSVSASASNESMSFRLAGSGEVEAVISGLSDGPACGTEFVPATSVSVIGTTITVTSPFTLYLCSIPPPLTPYQVAANLGHLGDSTYQVTWAEGPLQVTGQVSSTGLPTRMSAHLYAATPLGTLGGPYSRGLAINASGQITGYAWTADSHARAFLNTAGMMTDLGPPNGNSGGTGINASGQVTGGLTAMDGTQHAFLYSNSVLTDLGTPGETSIGTAINDRGQIVGTYTAGTGGFVYSDGVFRDLGVVAGGIGIQPSGINASGLVAGTVYLGGSVLNANAYLYSAAQSTNLGTIGGHWTVPSGLNDSGQVTGVGTTGGPMTHAFLYSGFMQDLGTVGAFGVYSAGKGINNAGQVVGYSDAVAFLYTDGAMYDLNTLVSSGLGTATLTEATAINDRGQIVANACPYSIFGESCTAFRLDPIPPPTVPAVEYYYDAWNYYFETASPDEIAILDGGAFGGVWKRTSETFNVWPDANTSSSQTCRFFSSVSFAPKSTHVYTPFDSECATLKLNAKWQYEGIAFHVQLADTAGLCAAGTVPLYRLYNNQMGGAPNHRYTTNETIRDQMIAAGWVFEGNADTKVFACVPQ